MTRLNVPDSTRYLLEATLTPARAAEYLSTLTRWVEGSGVEWTVKRLKSLLTAAKQLRGGNRTAVVSIYQTESIAYHKGSLLPKDKVLSMIFNTIATTQRRSVLKRQFGILRIGTMFQLEQCSSVQTQDSINTIARGPEVQDPKAISVLTRNIEMLAKKAFGDQSQKVKPLNLKRLKPFTSTYSGVKVPREVAVIPYGRAVYSLVTSAYIPEILMEEMPEELKDFLALIRSGGADEGTTGRLAFLPERGCKCRTIAVPNAWIQLLMEPVHTLLDQLIQRTTESAVHDQNKGAFYLKDQLTRNREVWCFDLSSATDLFPRQLQLGLLRGLNLNKYAEALDEMCSYWEYHQGHETDMVGHVDYGSGQPMGMYGSFPLFHLTHWALLKVIEQQVSRQHAKEINDSFRVLGDDVIINNRQVAIMYHGIMTKLAVPISLTKSINSSTLGEFAGFLGIKTKESVAVFRPYKHGSKRRDLLPLNLVDCLGSKCRKLSPKWANWYELYRHTLSWRNPDLSPLITENDKAGILPDKINRGTLNHLLFRVLTEQGHEFESNLDYEFGSSDSWNWDQVVSEVTYALLDEQRTSPSGFDIGLDGTRLDTEIKTREQQIWDDPLVKEVMKPSSYLRSENQCQYSYASDNISSCPWYNEETHHCSRQSNCPRKVEPE